MLCCSPRLALHEESAGLVHGACTHGTIVGTAYGTATADGRVPAQTKRSGRCRAGGRKCAVQEYRVSTPRVPSSTPGSRRRGAAAAPARLPLDDGRDGQHRAHAALVEESDVRPVLPRHGGCPRPPALPCLGNVGRRWGMLRRTVGIVSTVTRRRRRCECDEFGVQCARARADATVHRVTWYNRRTSLKDSRFSGGQDHPELNPQPPTHTCKRVRSKQPLRARIHAWVRAHMQVHTCGRHTHTRSKGQPRRPRHHKWFEGCIVSLR